MKRAISSSAFVVFLLSYIILSRETGSAAPENASEPSSQVIENTETENAVKNNPAKDVGEVSKNISENANDSVNADKAQLQKDQSIKKTEQIQTPVIRNFPPNPAGDGLLEIADDDLKYNRIPGITLHKKKKTIVVPEEIKNIPDNSQSSKPKEEKGLFGLKKSTTSLLVKILLICFIIAIIVLFKIRPKIKRDRKVLRRFPGA